ncbi:MAG: DoxX family protein [Blastocatellia bacterium]|nr:DoxX family protein [Blastocatellia bacterium]
MQMLIDRFLRASHPENPGTIVVRCTVAASMFIHGGYRVAAGTVGGFGGFLESAGLPAGLAVAWILTAVEIVGALSLLARVAVVPLSMWFIVQLATGVFLVHWSQGWFVVGGGTGGMEYSVVLIACFVSLVLSDEHSRSTHQ